MRYLRLRFLWSIEKLNIVHYYNLLLVKKKQNYVYNSKTKKNETILDQINSKFIIKCNEHLS